MMNTEGFLRTRPVSSVIWPIAIGVLACTNDFDQFQFPRGGGPSTGGNTSSSSSGFGGDPTTNSSSSSSSNSSSSSSSSNSSSSSSSMGGTGGTSEGGMGGMPSVGGMGGTGGAPPITNVECNGAACSQTCCVNKNNGTQTCKASCTGAENAVRCDDVMDCSGGDVCCKSGSTTDCGSSGCTEVCNLNETDMCSSGTCQADAVLPAPYGTCQ